MSALRSNALKIAIITTLNLLEKENNRQVPMTRYTDNQKEPENVLLNFISPVFGPNYGRKFVLSPPSVITFKY